MKAMDWEDLLKVIDTCTSALALRYDEEVHKTMKSAATVLRVHVERWEPATINQETYALPWQEMYKNEKERKEKLEKQLAEKEIWNLKRDNGGSVVTGVNQP